MLLWIDACDRSCGSVIGAVDRCCGSVIGAVDRSYGSELWIGAKEIGIKMIGARELWIGAVDRYRPRGRVDSQRERESFNRKIEKEQ